MLEEWMWGSLEWDVQDLIMISGMEDFGDCYEVVVGSQLLYISEL